MPLPPHPRPARRARLVLALSLLGALALGSQSPLAGDATAPTGQEQQLLVFINDARADHRYQSETGGVAQPLRWNPVVAEVARRHSAEMARAGRLSHTSTAGLDVGARLQQAGVGWTRVGENVAMAPTIEQIQNMIMSEPAFQANHRANVLDRRFTQVGIGIAAAGGQLYVTEDFLAAASEP